MPDDLAALDAWIADQSKPKPTRPEAIRRLVEYALRVPAASHLPRRTEPVSSERAAILAIADRAEASSRAKALAEQPKRRK